MAIKRHSMERQLQRSGSPLDRKRQLTVFVRAPQIGQVKTRLAKALGAAAALYAYKILVAELLNKLKSLPNVELRFTPDKARAQVRQWLQPTWRLAPQGEGELGKRLARAFEEAFRAGIQRVLIIGSDCPGVAAQDVEAAWGSLITHDVVLGPAKDGGYWLIGLRRPRPGLFENVPWSTSAVLETTLSRVRAARLKVKCLRTLADVDTAEDWSEFMRARRVSRAVSSRRMTRGAGSTAIGVG